MSSMSDIMQEKSKAKVNLILKDKIDLYNGL